MVELVDTYLDGAECAELLEGGLVLLGRQTTAYELVVPERPGCMGLRSANSCQSPATTTSDAAKASVAWEGGKRYQEFSRGTTSSASKLSKRIADARLMFSNPGGGKDVMM